MSQVSALLPALSGLVQGQVTRLPGQRGQTDLEAHQGAADQHEGSGKHVIDLLL